MWVTWRWWQLLDVGDKIFILVTSFENWWQKGQNRHQHPNICHQHRCNLVKMNWTLIYTFSAKFKNYCAPKVCNKCRSYLVRNYGGKSRIILNKYFQRLLKIFWFYLYFNNIIFRQVGSTVADVCSTCEKWKMLFICIWSYTFYGKKLEIRRFHIDADALRQPKGEFEFGINSNFHAKTLNSVLHFNNFILSK